MLRKIVKQGTSTLMVSLPSKWAKLNNLDKGDEVSIEEDGQKLIIKLKEEKKKDKKSKIDLSGYSPLINRVLLSLYIQGVDELEITIENFDSIKDFQKRVVNELIGFEIIKQTNNSALIKDISGISDQEIDDIVKRIFFVLNSMVEELIIAIEKKESMQPIIEIDASINKFANFCLRILNKKGYKDSKKTPHFYGIVSILEEIGDLYKNIAVALDKKEKLEKVQLEVLKETKESLNLFEGLVFNFNKEGEVEFAKKYEKIKGKIKGNNKMDFLLYQVNESLVRMNNYLLVMSL